MSTEIAVPEPEDVPTRAMSRADRRKEKQERLKEQTRDQFDGLVGKAIATVAELCEMGDSEAVRLDAAKTIFRMAEVDPAAKREVNVQVDDRRAVRAELEATLMALARNNPAVVEGLTGSVPELDEVENVIDVVAEEDKSEGDPF